MTGIIAKPLTLAAAGLLALPWIGHAEPLFRHPLSSDTSAHSFFDHDPTDGALDWKCEFETRDLHRGTDFTGSATTDVPRGREIFAAAAGSVIRKTDGFGDGFPGSTDGFGLGNHVRLLHPSQDFPSGLISVYAHMTIGSVTTQPVGATVECGALIGGIGTSGSSTGLHLHFDVRIKETSTSGTRIDPYAGPCNPEDGLWFDQGENNPSPLCATPNAALHWELYE